VGYKAPIPLSGIELGLVIMLGDRKWIYTCTVSGERHISEISRHIVFLLSSFLVSDIILLTAEKSTSCFLEALSLSKSFHTL